MSLKTFNTKIANYKIGKMSIKLESFNSELLIYSCKKIVNILQNTSSNKSSLAHSLGVVSLPTKKRIYCVLRSPHVDKDSREHFEIKVHKKVLEIYYDSESTVFKMLAEADLPIGVSSTVSIKDQTNTP